MNKKAFTLIELLATIIILGVIGVIVYPTLNRVIGGNKEKAYIKQVEEVERIAGHWVANNDMLLPYENDKSYYLYLEELYSKGLIDKETTYNPKTNEEMKGCVVITWKSDMNQHTYTYDEECSSTEPPVIAMNVDNNIINSKGWAKENFYVKVVGEYLTSYNYCISETDCTPTTEVTGTSGSIYITKEGTSRVCVEGINKTGKTETKCESYKLDKTVPVIGNILVNGTMGLNNWYVSNVIVSKTESSDTLSGIESNELSPSVTNITSDTTGTEYTLTAKDNAGNISTRSHSFKIDKTKPVVGSANIAGTLGSNSWYTSNVTITPANGSDATSGHSSTSISKSSITSETSGTEVIVTTKDQAGNTSTKSYTIKIDKTAPTVGTANIAGTLGSNGWYTSNVTITTNNGADSLSGHNSTTSNINSITSNTTGQTITLTTIDIAGNVSTKTHTVKVDKGSPLITAKGGLVEITVGDNNVVSNYFNPPTYSISGGNVSCSPENTSILNAGNHVVTCTANGNNGLSKKASIDFIVNGVNAVYDYTGSEQTVTIAKAGIYRLQAWGAQGSAGGKGGYVSGDIILKVGDVLTIATGGINGFNGGGSGSKAGGGPSTIRLNKEIILIAAGGGGGPNGTVGGNGDGTGGSNVGSGAGSNGINGGGGGSSADYNYSCGCSTCGGGCASYAPTYSCNCQTCGGGCSVWGENCSQIIKDCILYGDVMGSPICLEYSYDTMCIPTFECVAYAPTYSCNCQTCGGGCTSYYPTYTCGCSTCTTQGNGGKGGTNVIGSNLINTFNQAGIRENNGYISVSYLGNEG